MAIPNAREKRDDHERQLLAKAIESVAAQLEPRERDEQELRLASFYRRHWRARNLLVAALQEAKERTRKAKARGLTSNADAEIERAAERASPIVVADGKRRGDRDFAIAYAMIERIVAIAFATWALQLRDRTVADAIADIPDPETKAGQLALAAASIAADSGADAFDVALAAAIAVIGAEVDTFAMTDLERIVDTEGAKVVRIDHSYLVPSIQTAANRPQLVLVGAMKKLGYRTAGIRRVLSKAKGDDVDDGQVRKLVRDLVSAHLS